MCCETSLSELNEMIIDDFDDKNDDFVLYKIQN